MGDKVLVVDDEQQVRDLLNTFLKREGYEVVVASNGEEAMELAEAENPHVILLDVNMPGIDGIEVCNRLKAKEKTRPIPIIIVTVHEDRNVEAFLEGADDFVTKPFNTVEFSFRVRSMLRIRHLADELERSQASSEDPEKNRFKR